MDKSTNQIIAEWMGECWHELELRSYTGSKTGSESFCKYCDVMRSGGFTFNPDYTSSLDAVSVAEKKAVEVFGVMSYLEAMMKLINAEDGREWVTEMAIARPLVTAPASIRAAAVRNLIEESKS